MDTSEKLGQVGRVHGAMMGVRGEPVNVEQVGPGWAMSAEP